MSKLVCGCSAIVGRINDGKNEEISVECAECMQNGGQFNKSSQWVEPQRPVNIDDAQLDAYGTYKPAGKPRGKHK